MDKEIIDRWKECYKKAEELVGIGIGIEKSILVGITANTLMNDGYIGIKKHLLNDVKKLEDSDGYIMAGYPAFLGLFGRDSLITSWQFLEHNPLIARNTLITLQKFQGKKNDAGTGEEPGKILHEYYKSDISKSWWDAYKSNVEWLTPGIPVYFSVDSTLLYVIVAAEYINKEHDYPFYQVIYQSLLDALQWATKQGKNKELYISYGPDVKKIGWGLQNQAWKDSESYKITPPVYMVEVQGYLYAAINAVAKLDNNEHPPIVNKLKKKFNKEFWIKERQYYAMALDGHLDQADEVTSNPGHLLFTGILTRRREKAVVKKLFSDELWTPYGIRTHSTDSPLFDQYSYHLGSVWPHDNWVIAQGLKKCGYEHEYNLIKEALYKAYDDLGCIPEYYGVSLNHKLLKLPACYPQAWASGALLNFVLEDNR